MNKLESRGKTAIRRRTLSAPVKWLLDNRRLQGFVLDYGCGLGQDVDILNGSHCFNTVHGWDPVHKPDIEPSLYNTVYCNYVLNVLDSTFEMAEVINNCLAKLLGPNDFAYFAVRNRIPDLRGPTSKGTYQCHVRNIKALKKLYSNGSFIIYRGRSVDVCLSGDIDAVVYPTGRREEFKGVPHTTVD